MPTNNMFDQFDDAPEMASANMFDQFDDAPTQPVSPPQQFSLHAERAAFPTVFDAEDAALRKPITPDQLEAVTPVAPQQGLADFLAPVLNGAEALLKPMGFSWDNARQAQQEMERLPWMEQAATNLAGIDTGMAQIGDALINLPAGLIQQGAGVPPAERWRSNMQGAIESWAPVAARKQAAPHAFNVSAGVGSTAAPVPMLGPASIFKGWQTAIKAGSPLANVLNVMGGGAITAGALGGGEAVKDNRQIEPQDVVMPAIAGGLTAGLVTGGIVGTAKGSKAIAKLTATVAREAQERVTQASRSAVKSAMEQYNKLRPLERKQVLQGIAEENVMRDQAAAAEKLMSTLGIQDAESRAAVGAMGGQVTDGLPLAPPPASVTGPRNPDPRLPRSLSEAKPKYGQWKPSFASDLDKALYTVANRQEKSRADDRYYKWIQENTGWSDAEISSRAREVKLAVKNAPRTSDEKFAVPKTSNRYLEQAEQLVDQAQKSDNPMQSTEIVEEWAEKVTGEPAAVTAPAPEASSRKTLDREFYGRKKNQLARSAEEFHPAVKSVVDEIATRKAYLDYDEAVYQKALERVWEKFAKDTDAETFQLTDKVTLKRSEVFPAKASPKTERQIESEYEALTDGVVPSTEKKHFAATLSEEIKIDDVAIPDTAEGAAEKLLELKGFVKGSKEAYENTKIGKVQERIAKVEQIIANKEAAKKPNQDLIAEYRQELSRLRGEEDFARMAEDVIKQIDSDSGEFHLKTSIPHPSGEGSLEVAVEYKHNAQRKTLPSELAEQWKERAAELRRADPAFKPLTQFSASFSAKAGAAMAGVIAVMSQQSANAAEIGAKMATSPDVIGMWNHLPLNEFALAAAITKLKLPQKAAQKLLSAEMAGFKGVPIGSIWKDTMDHIGYSDRLLGGNPLSAQIWSRLGHALRATWGVKISPELRESALGALREGHITMDEAIKGELDFPLESSAEAMDAVKIFAGLNQAQRNAVTMYRIVQKDIMRLLVDRHDELKTWRTENPSAPNQAAAKHAQEAMEYMMRSLGKRSETTHDIDSTISKLVSNWMDFNFFWNPDHHATNLTDMWIAGSSRVGVRNIWRANKLLLGNAELRSLFKNSNLTGGYRADQAEVGAIAGKSPRKIWTEHDLESDLVNADRVFLGHALQYFQMNEKAIQAAGFKGSDEKFVRDLVAGKLPEDIAVDVWAKSAETLSRTLGVDIYRINTNLVNQAPMAKSLGIFMRQPARLSRLAMNYVAEGDFKSLYTMLGATMVLGGAAAIPSDLKFLVQNLNPDSAFKMAALADEVDLFYKATGYKLSPKITWSILWLNMAASNPVGDMAKGPLEVLKGTNEGNPEKIVKGLEKTAPYLAPRWFGAPAGTIIRTLEGARRAFGDKEEKAYVERYGDLQMSETGHHSLDNLPDQLRAAADPLLPGRSAWAEGYKTSKDESYYAKNNALRGPLKMLGLAPRSRPIDDQFFRKSASPIDPTVTGYEDGYNIPDALLSPLRKP